MVDSHRILWKDYIELLKSSNFKLTWNEDDLVWILSQNESYSPKYGYIQLIKERDLVTRSGGGGLFGNSSLLSSLIFSCGSYFQIKI